jgi:acetylornithine deacetylase/succinyl-diaminopimelate desuccinylase-like protein
MEIWNQYIEDNRERFIDELKTLLTIPSVSTDDNFRRDVNLCAELVKEFLLSAGCKYAAVCPTQNHPIVYGQRIIDPAKPTVLVYGHYDVQPTEPNDLWQNDPFSPTIQEGMIIARGASDDKGQLFMHIKALEIMIKTNTLPCNIKFIIEGEEEIGSPSLHSYLLENRRTLSADIVLISDTAMIDLEHPSIDISLRGLTYMEVTLTGPNRDLHSGVYGGAVANPLNILCKIIASLQDHDNKILIPGFYDNVKDLDAGERSSIQLVPFDQHNYEEELGIKEVFGEKDYTTLERIGIRPSLDVNGIWGGYMEKGAKTVLPSQAHAKISMRLVPDQQPAEIANLFQAYVDQIAPASVNAEVRYLHGGDPMATPTDSKGYQAAIKAIRATFGKAPIPVHSGGSIPVVALFKEILNIDTVLLGFGLDNDRIHSPNEKFDLINFFKGIETISHYYQYFAG